LYTAHVLLVVVVLPDRRFRCFANSQLGIYNYALFDLNFSRGLVPSVWATGGSTAKQRVPDAPL
jgi:hypothetical protein